MLRFETVETGSWCWVGATVKIGLNVNLDFDSLRRTVPFSSEVIRMNAWADRNSAIFFLGRRFGPSGSASLP